ncbi:MAG: redoxin domain-containing protein [Opitutaceae bacterium]|nr:redoxin domain-containing protein [Opitutaceae bacterium]
MKPFTHSFFAAALVAVVALVSSAAAAERPEVGQPAPDFTLTDTRGVVQSLSAFKGKVVVLEWINHGCPFVIKHYDSANMQKTQKAAAADGAVWLSICSSAPGKQGHMTPAEWNTVNAAKSAAPLAVLLDEDGKVGKRYHATNTPQLFVIDAAGRIAYSGAIDSIASAKGEDVPKAQNHVLAALADLKAGRPVATPVTKPYGCSVKYAD